MISTNVKPVAPWISRDRVAWITALAFVVLTLIALVAIPVLVQRRVDDLRTNIETSEPARTVLITLQFNLVREMSALQQYAAGGGPEFAGMFQEARTAETVLWQELAPLARALGDDVLEHFVEARTLATQWHQRLNEDEVIRRGRGSMSLLQSAEVRQRFDEVLSEAAALDSAIVRATARSRAKISAAERTGILLTFASGVLALVAATIVGALVLRIRRLAAEAERRRRQAADALAQSARAAEARQRLLRGITHDVKNPLGAARGYAELLNMGVKGELNGDQQNLVAGVERSIDSALAIISDLLDLARTDSGGVSVHRVDVDLNHLVREAVEDHHAAATTAGLAIESAVSGSLVAYTDPARVRQVIDNMLSNAIKYTPAPGRIRVRTDPNARDAPFSKRAVAILVSDTGPGIPEDKRESIFDEFTRLDDDGAMKGHGLGLAIARRMARLVGGDLGLGAHTGPGSTFALWLPQREQRSEDR